MRVLYIVATPIGNLQDITFRALEVLRAADVIACEDTRRTLILLNHYHIKKNLISYHEHSRIQKIEFLIRELESGKSIALVSDAGTPGISDPGSKLVQAAVQNGIPVIPIPGPSAAIAALSVSGFGAAPFIFYGFLPHKKGKETVLKKIAESDAVSVFYESPHRIVKTLEKMRETLGEERKIFAARELTKKFETMYRGNISQVIKQLKNDKVLGEFVVVVGHKP